MSRSTRFVLVAALFAGGALDVAAQARAVTRVSAPPPPSLTKPVPATFFAGLRYRNVGPARGGRVTTVTGVAQQPLTFYMGPTGGGVWKSVNAGQTWTNVSDRFFNVGSMGDIDVADSDPNVIFAGTGSDGYRSNVAVGRGVYKSTDAGTTWSHVGLATVGNIGGVRIHPVNPQIAFVAAIGNPFKPNVDRGVFRTTDGGRNWSKVLFVSDSTGAVDVEFMPGNPSVIYASMWRAERKPWTIISGAREGGIYKSSDGGTTWKKLGGGLPNALFGKSNLAVTPASPNSVWAIVEAKPGSGLYRSDDAGETWRLLSDFAPMLTRPFYYTGVTVHPRDPNTVWTYSEGFYKSTDGGRSWRSQNVPHGDNHDLWINPEAPDIMIQSNDGGANVTIDGGRSWSSIYNQPTAEIYQVTADNQFPYRLYGAQQDNSTLIVPSLPLSTGRPDSPMQEWMAGPGCETGPIMPHRTNPDTVYGACKGQFSRMSIRSGQEQQYWNGGQSLYGNPGKDLILRFQRVSPMEVSPHEPNTVYYGSQYVHRTRDGGITWETISPDMTLNPPERQQTSSGEPITIDVTGEEHYSTLYAIRESTLEPGVIWTGSNDGPFFVTRNGGRTWTDVTPRGLAPASSDFTRNNFRGPPDGCRTQNIEPSPHRRGSAYYAVHCYLLGDFRPFLYRTDDYGQTWTLLTPGTNGIPADEPTRVVREDPEREGLLYAGTEFAMYISFDNGKRWQPFQLNLPSVPVTDLRVHRGDLIMSTQGRSFWILNNLSIVRQAGDQVIDAPVHLFKPAEQYRHRYAGSFGGVESSRNDPADPQYPPMGAQIDYWLGANVSGAATLEILDASGKVLRRFTSEGPGESATTQPSMRQMVTEVSGTPRLPRTPGHNRFTWDLTLPGPWDANSARSGRNGPMVLPGSYQVRLTAGGATATQPLVLRMDPRIARDGVTLVALREQLDHNLKVRDMVTEVNQLAANIEEGRTRLRTATSAADTLKMLEDLRSKIVTPSIRYSKPELQAHIQYLYSMTMQSDQKIGRDAITRYATLRKDLDDRILEAKKVLGPRVAM
ncbi:MAG: WD40/YVTN/BNR-like repeat-containing protein [Gemmatimonadaceae bacterium]